MHVKFVTQMVLSIMDLAAMHALLQQHSNWRNKRAAAAFSTAFRIGRGSPVGVC